jgi:DUF1680 family protein
MNKMRRTFPIGAGAWAAGVVAGLLLAAGCSVRDERPGAEAARLKITPAVRAFPLKNVRLLEGPFKDAMERNTKYLHALDTDRLLHNFRVNAGLPSSAAPLGGWEEPKVELRGHFVGHFLSGCALTYAATGDEALRQKAAAVVAELARCQQALGPSGYLSAFPEEFIDRVIQGKRVWAPWYTLHKIMAGLLDTYTLCGNGQALAVAEKMAAWAKARLDALDDAAVQRMLRVEHGGMAEVLANLYALTGNPDHLALARRFDHKMLLEPLAAGRDELKGLHVNTQIPKVIGAAREYELTGDTSYADAALYFWDEVANRRSYCTGGTSNYEAWRAGPDELASELSNASHETCCTYNMLKLTRELFTWSADPALADYYERALWNGILPTQDPETGMTMYYVPMESGWYKTFGTANDSFWCCTGTGVENHAKYGDSIYFRGGDALFVNLFIASELSWPEKGLTLRQETSFPEEEGTSLVFSSPCDVRLNLRLRVPGWAAKGVSVRVNGEPLGVEVRPGTYLSIARAWKNGDRVDVRLPMALRLWRMPDNPNVAAVMYGPIVLAGELPTEDLAKEKVYGPYHAEGVPAAAPEFVPPSDDLDAWIKPLPGRALAFRTVNAGRPADVDLVPFYRLFGRRYAIYWNFFSESGWSEMEASRKARAARARARQKEITSLLVDRVEVGRPESERAHALDRRNSSSGSHLGRPWRDASDGGWFDYELRTLPGRPVSLLCTYWGSDVGRTFDILVDGKKIATQTVNVNYPGDFFDVQYRIPEELTRGKSKIRVRFQAPPEGTAGGLFGLVLLKER